jgi:hypothetical protein
MTSIAKVVRRRPNEADPDRAYWLPARRPNAWRTSMFGLDP